MKLTSITASVLLAISASSAIAATDGALGLTTTGTADISANLVGESMPEYQISGLGDISPSDDIQAGSTDRVYTTVAEGCVYATQPGSYTLEVSVPHLVGENTGGLMPYELRVVGVRGGIHSLGTFIPSGTTSLMMESMLPSDFTDCSDNHFLSYSATIDPGLPGFPTQTDVYSASITFTVMPQ